MKATTTTTTTTATTAAARACRKRKLLLGQSLMLLCIHMGIWLRMGWWSTNWLETTMGRGDTLSSSSWLNKNINTNNNENNNTIINTAKLTSGLLELLSTLPKNELLNAMTAVDQPSSSSQQQQQPQPQQQSISPASDSNDDDSKPYFILHIGPPKSGTTTLQEELTAAHDLLRLDNYLYTGQYYKNDKLLPLHMGSNNNNMTFVKSILSQQCHLQLEQRRLRFQKRQQQQHINNHHHHHKNNQSSSSLANVLRQVDCWKDALTVLESFRLNKTNIIHSDETYGYKWRYWATSSSTMQQKENTTVTTLIAGPWDWISLHETLHDWNVVIVVGYRRYAEWIMSVKQHAEKWTGRKPRHAQWPTQKNHNGHGGLLFAPPFPNILTVQLGLDDDGDDDNNNKNMSSSLKPYYPFYDVNFILESLQKVRRHDVVPLLDVRILNLHEETTAQQMTSSVRTTFLCHVLNNAPNACRKSRAMDHRHHVVFKQAPTAAATRALLQGRTEEEQHTHTHTQTTTASTQILRRRRRRRANVAKNTQSVMYDVLATTAAAMGMVNTSRHERRQIVEYCQDFHKKTLQNAILPFNCPTKEQLQALLDLSLQKEAAVFETQLLATTATTTTTKQHRRLLLPPFKKHHVDSFWKVASFPNHTNKYCWIDAPAVLQTTEWKEMFASLEHS